MSDVSEDELAAFIGPRAPYYLRAWRSLSAHQTNFGGVNRAAFFCSAAWLLYRRLYRLAAIFLGVVLLESIVSAALFRHRGVPTPVSYDLLTTAIYATVAGLFANRWYYHHARGRITALKNRGIRSPAALAEQGGTSWLAPIVGILAALLLLRLGLGLVL